MNREALIEVGKSFLRAVWFGIFGVIAAALTNLAADADLLKTVWTLPVVEVALPVGAYIVAGIGFVVKAIDGYIHNNKNIDSKGIAPPFLQG